jgi:hypothetical protein
VIELDVGGNVSLLGGFNNQFTVRSATIRIVSDLIVLRLMSAYPFAGNSK